MRDSNDELDNAKLDAFVELIEYIDQCVDEGVHMFKLSEVSSLYVQRLVSLGIEKSINKTRLKKAFLEHFSGALQEQTDGKNTILVFGEAVSNLLKDAFKLNYSEEAEILARAAAIVRKDIFSHESFTFSGSFPINCQSSYLPSSLRSLISMILNGLDIKAQEKIDNQACLTVCETIIFNSKKRLYKTKTSQSRHAASREPPLPLYVRLCIHSSTRCKTLIKKMYQLGISVSYDRVIQIEEQLAKSLCERYKED